MFVILYMSDACRIGYLRSRNFGEAHDQQELRVGMPTLSVILVGRSGASLAQARKDGVSRAVQLPASGPPSTISMHEPG